MTTGWLAGVSKSGKAGERRMLKVKDVINALSVCDPDADVYIEVDLDHDIPANLENWERGTVRFTIDGFDEYRFGVFPRIKYHKW